MDYNSQEEDFVPPEWEKTPDIPIFQGSHKSVCNTCNKTGMLLCCDYCSLSFHPSCLQPPITERPIDFWMCPICCADYHTGNVSAIRTRCREGSCRAMSDW